mmetsp:Transcript_19907/g.59511  ORF Transcript_19907/g.59511 Transcript_19907/m.59511 type:complete len:241 (-) Transcript_19907:116-838(-)
MQSTKPQPSALPSGLTHRPGVAIANHASRTPERSSRRWPAVAKGVASTATAVPSSHGAASTSTSSSSVSRAVACVQSTLQKTVPCPVVTMIPLPSPPTTKDVREASGAWCGGLLSHVAAPNVEDDAVVSESCVDLRSFCRRRLESEERAVGCPLSFMSASAAASSLTATACTGPSTALFMSSSASNFGWSAPFPFAPDDLVPAEMRDRGVQYEGCGGGGERLRDARGPGDPCARLPPVCR